MACPAENVSKREVIEGCHSSKPDEEVRRNLRKISLKLHPDKNPGCAESVAKPRF